ncbi:hypothetical protein [Pedobacter agri]|uniref:hypothetical protein n=1 Tax=Pedobacter agri TaxID=454586 RepID=UPI0027891F11|nr:hypothetical protein [Pedobacter agri]MDQ1140516.1 hypothetical protein [Pedobacter agri]
MIFNIEFLSSLGKKTELQNRNGLEVIKYCKEIDWLQEWKNYYHAYRSSEYIPYEDYWFLDISDPENKRNLDVSCNYIDERNLLEENLSLIVTFSWYSLEKAGWFTKLLTRREHTKVWDARHSSEISSQDLPQIVKWFVEGDISQLDLILPNPGEFQFDVD